jgi:hypothetical protein
MRFAFVLLILFCGKSLLRADSTTFKPKRFWGIIGGTSVAYAGSMVGLSNLWYKNQPRSSFHFFNDNHEWKQIDKLGHAATAFHESRAGIKMLLWTGMPTKKAVLYGSMAGFLFQTPIEILDGFSASYGASVGDLAANTTGSLLVLTQYLIWEEVNVQMKFSYRPTGYADLRPNVLGSNGIQRVLKDYNGQTYWLSANLKSIFFKQRKFPAWLNVAVGHGANEMIYGDPKDNKANGFNSYRQWYLSLDVDPEKIKTKSKALKTVFFALNMFKMPFPTLSMNGKGQFQFLPFY